MHDRYTTRYGPLPQGHADCDHATWHSPEQEPSDDRGITLNLPLPLHTLCCRRAGRSRVKFEGIPWSVILRHILKRDFFNAAVNAKIW